LVVVLGMQLPSASGMRFRTGFDACIGETPLILLSSLSHATSCLILGKAEFMNPGGSVKDRAALYMINAAEREGAIKKGGWLVEATAGNTGIGLVHIANQRGYKCLFTCSASTSEEKIRLLQTLGAEIVRCPAVPPSHPDHFQNQAKRLAQERGAHNRTPVWCEKTDRVVNLPIRRIFCKPVLQLEQHGSSLQYHRTRSLS